MAAIRYPPPPALAGWVNGWGCGMHSNLQVCGRRADEDGIPRHHRRPELWLRVVPGARPGRAGRRRCAGVAGVAGVGGGGGARTSMSQPVMALNTWGWGG